jgi:hypothetical protein
MTTAGSATVGRVLTGIQDGMRRWRFVLLVLALASAIGAGATATHGALDASVPQSAVHEHAHTGILVGLVGALVVAAAARVRHSGPPTGHQRTVGRPSDEDRRWCAPRRGAAIALAPSPASLCRFLT